MLREERLIGAGVSSAFDEDLARADRRLARALRLYLSVGNRALVARQPLFASLPLLDSQQQIARMLLERSVLRFGRCPLRRAIFRFSTV